MTTTTAIPTGAKMPFDFEEIIKVPFTMKPYFQVYSNEDMQNDISRYTKYPALITDILEDRAKEFNTLGNRIWFESNIAIENDLIDKAAEKMNLNKHFKNIVELGLAIPDDIIIMHEGRIEACFVAFASGWDPSTTKGKTLAEVHSPVADNEKLIKASETIVKAITGENCYHRYTWAISSISTRSNHPFYERPDFDKLAALTFRIEHEKTIPIVENESVVFLIQVSTNPLPDVLNECGPLLLESINTMSNPVLEYKNLTKVKSLLNNDPKQKKGINYRSKEWISYAKKKWNLFGEKNRV